MDDIPGDVAAALGRTGLSAFFADCTAPHRREYLKWIAEAKRPETRAARIAKTVERLAEKRAQEQAATRKGP
jgi:uncharacterized protein YdeI (YjbR/CyaY-like superfamily)